MSQSPLEEGGRFKKVCGGVLSRELSLLDNLNFRAETGVTYKKCGEREREEKIENLYRV